MNLYSCVVGQIESWTLARWLVQLGQTEASLGWKEIDGSRAISVLLDEATMILRARCRMDSSPAMLTVVAETMDVAAEVWSVTTIAVHSLALVANLIVKHIRFHFNLQYFTEKKNNQY